MHEVEPKVFLIGETKIRQGQLSAYLAHIGAEDWTTDAFSDGEALVEFMGRLCYRSFKPGMNPNVTKVREGSEAYLSNIIGVGHGSVLEHVQLNFVFADVSRVFTHELVRHRVGTAFSQESLRFVRLNDLGLWLPEEIEADPVLKAMFEKTFESLEDLQNQMSDHLKLDEEKNFGRKKKFTSAMRRIAPIGLSTTIGCSMNIRTLRHLIFMRTSRHAEVEIRVVFDMVARICKGNYPNLFADFEQSVGDDGQPLLIDGAYEWTTPHIKV